MTDFTLIMSDKLTKPATVLIEKISDAVGGIFKPYQIVRVAKAEVEADRIHADSQIQITDIHRRAMHRFLEEEARKQINIESITEGALPLLEEKSTPQNIADDWITNFFDKCRIVSDSDMQQLWSRILAGEANNPGGFSRRTVNLVSDLEKSDAELFAALCGFAWKFGNLTPLVFDIQGEIYTRNGLNFNAFLHLESLGLIQLEGIGNFVRTKLPKKITLFYYGIAVELTLPNEENNQLITGNVSFTRAGIELATVCGSKPVDGFFDFVCERWKHQSLILEYDSQPDITSGG
jgi:hypothetical protein